MQVINVPKWLEIVNVEQEQTVPHTVISLSALTLSALQKCTITQTSRRAFQLPQLPLHYNRDVYVLYINIRLWV